MVRESDQPIYTPPLGEPRIVTQTQKNLPLKSDAVFMPRVDQLFFPIPLIQYQGLVELDVLSHHLSDRQLERTLLLAGKSGIF